MEGFYGVTERTLRLTKSYVKLSCYFSAFTPLEISRMFCNINMLIETDRRLEKLHAIYYMFFTHILMNAQKHFCAQPPMLQVSPKLTDNKVTTAVGKQEGSFTVMFCDLYSTQLWFTALFLSVYISQWAFPRKYIRISESKVKVYNYFAP